MESMIKSFFYRLTIENWQRKVIALLAAIIVWLFVNHSIYETKTISNVPLRIINLPPDKTISGLLPNGLLSRRITLTLMGSKDIIDNMESGDFEVLLDASTADNDDWVVTITKKNLVSLTSSIDLPSLINNVDHASFVIKLSKLVTARIELTIEPPTGIPPQGYEYLDIWPQHIYQSVSGPEDVIQELKESGLSMSFDLSDITKEQLDAILSTAHNDEISFNIPKKWKRLYIPIRHTTEDLNDPEAQNMRIDFLRKEFLPLDKEIPIRIFYPLDELEEINPKIYSIAYNDDIQDKLGTAIFTKPLFAKEVSRLFIDVIRNSIEIVIRAAPKNKRKVLAWSVQFINPNDLEDTYVALSIGNSNTGKGFAGLINKNQEELLRKRFRDYMQKLNLYLPNAKKLHLKSTVEGDHIKVVAY